MRRCLITVLLAATAACAQTQKQPSPKPQPEPSQLKFVLVLSRHGIRPPLAEAATINQYTADPWPDWEVPLGHLTPHGAEALTQMGSYMRLRYVEEGLLSPECPAPSEIYLYADTDERNISSTRATMDGMFPNCDHLDINTIAPTTTDVPDPLFSPVPKTFPAPEGPAAIAALRAALHNDPDLALSAKATPELNELAHIFAPDPAQPAAKPILQQSISLGPGIYGATAHGPLPTASNLVEDLELEYIDNKPLGAVGWGLLGDTDATAEATLQRLLPIHIKAFGLMLRTPIFARAEGSNLLAHILTTLQQATNMGAPSSPAVSSSAKVGSQDAGALAPADTKLLYLSGHDSNLFTLGGLLNLHWTADHRTDDTPPDTQLAFELWQRPADKTSAAAPEIDIRIIYRAQTLHQLRTAEPLTLDNPPAEVELTPTGCLAHKPCPLTTFLAAAQKQIDPHYIHDLLPLQPVR